MKPLGGRKRQPQNPDFNKSAMPKFCSRLLLIVLAFFIFQNTFAARFYVNINNPTPGGGFSWATAFTDLQDALAASSPYDEIWVAKGTYKPTSGTDRTIAFMPKTGQNILGGFLGTETAATQRDYINNVTILSGDIGIPGTAADNSYNVLRYLSVDGSSAIDGFTIQDGYADQAPTATPSMYNMGGGLYAQGSSAGQDMVWTRHCIFQNNYAVYGGAYGAYTNNGRSSLLTQYTTFKNNTADIGGAVCVITYGGSTSSNADFVNSIFINNTANDGSVINNQVDGSTSRMTPYLVHCVLYNNGPGLVDNMVTNSGVGRVSVINSIVWRDAGAYTTENLNVPGISYSNSIVDFPTAQLTASSVSNGINADPQFVDATNGNWHLEPCSPAIDAVTVTISAVGSDVDYDGTTRPQGSSNPLGGYNADMGIYETAKTISPLPTATSPQNFCEGQPGTIEAAGDNLVWYTTATGGTGDAAAPPANVATAGTSYHVYVTQTVAGSCESQRLDILVGINAVPAGPSVTPVTYCLNETATPIAAVNPNIFWYDNPAGGTGTNTPPTPNTSATGTYTWYVTSKSANCESVRTPITATVSKSADPGVVTPLSYCLNNTASPLTATGTGLLWYTSSTGGVGSSTAPTPNTTATGSTAYYVTQTDASGCESERVELDVNIGGSQSAVPTVSDLTYCLNQTVPPLTATGSNLKWYTTASGGTGNTNAPIPSTAVAGTTNYYVSQTSGCESPRAEITVTVNVTSAPGAIPETYCQSSPASPLTAVGDDLLWYTAAKGGTGDPAAPTPSTVVPGTTTWYVSQTENSCESSRTPVTVTVTRGPSVDFSTNGSCAGMPVTIINTSGGTSTTIYTWNFYDAVSATGSDPGPYQVTWANPGDYTVTLTADDGACENRTQRMVTIGAAPVISVTPGDGSYCLGTKVPLTASGAISYQWSPATGLSAASGNSVTALFAGAITYTVTGTDVNGCTATTQVQLTRDLNCQIYYYLPTAFSPNGDGLNDVLRVKTSDLPQTFSMLVFNRLGQQVFESHDPNTGWDGTQKGQPSAAGAYICIMNAVSSAGEVIKQNATVILTR
jgi:gliding motility-associated-like protein